MGEATDHLSAASVSDLTAKVNNARSVSEGQNASSQILRTLFTNIPGGDGDQLTREMDSVSNMRSGQPGGMDPSQMSPQELHDVLWKILSFRDSVMKKIENTIDRIPGLSGLVEKISCLSLPHPSNQARILSSIIRWIWAIHQLHSTVRGPGSLQLGLLKSGWKRHSKTGSVTC